MSDCIFCRIASGEIPARMAGTSETAVAFHDLNPQAPTHVLIIPREHLARASDTAGRAEVWNEVMALAVETASALGLEAGGYRLVVNQGRDGGQSVDHLHVHLLGGRRMAWPPG